jgi:hypothetical protein
MYGFENTVSNMTFVYALFYVLCSCNAGFFLRLVFRLMIHVREADVLQERSHGVQLLDLSVEILACVLAFIDYGTLHNIFPFVSRKCKQLARNVGPRYVFNMKNSDIPRGVTEKELRRVCD